MLHSHRLHRRAGICWILNQFLSIYSPRTREYVTPRLELATKLLRSACSRDFLTKISGSPVWVRPTDYFNAEQNDGGKEKPPVPFSGDTDVILLGLLHGRWAISKQAMEGLSAQYTEEMVSGMSIIVPAHKILEVINQPELEAMRTKDEMIAKKSSSAGS